MTLREWIETEMPHMEGWCSIEKAKKITEIVHELRPDVSVEIGVFSGRSLFAIAKALEEYHPTGKVYGIDPWTTDGALEGEHDPESSKWWEKLDLNYFYHYTLKHRDIYELGKWCEIIRDRSENLLDQFQSIDFLHIDGNHSELASVRDVNNFVTKVRDGGIILMDDLNWSTTKEAQSILRTMAKQEFVYDFNGESWGVFRKEKHEKEVQEKEVT